MSELYSVLHNALYLKPLHPKVDGGPPSEYGPVSKLWLGGWVTETKVMQSSSLIIYSYQLSIIINQP